VPPIVIYFVVALGAYLLGSIPTGFLVARAKGIDIRKAGSGNIGATNSMRVLGKPAGIFVLLVDVLKGFAAVAWLPILILKIFSTTQIDLETLRIVAGIFAVLGHNYPCWLKFKGGKGIATALGVFIALAPWVALASLLVFILIVALTRYVSLASIIAAITVPFFALVLAHPHNRQLLTGLSIISFIGIAKHHANIRRLLNGTESKFGKSTSARRQDSAAGKPEAS
jgi:glycerol-3-phosphate acyltransferase PlsY